MNKIFFCSLFFTISFSCGQENNEQMLINANIWSLITSTETTDQFNEIFFNDQHIRIYNPYRGLQDYEYRIESDSIYIDEIGNAFHFTSDTTMTLQNENHKSQYKRLDVEQLENNRDLRYLEYLMKKYIATKDSLFSNRIIEMLQEGYKENELRIDEISIK